VFAASGYNTGGGRADIKRSGDQFEAKEVFFTKKIQNHHGGVILHDGMIYGCSNPKDLTCLDFNTSDVKWTDKSSGKCSILYADGMLYCRDEKGPISLVEATADGFKLKGRFDQLDRSKLNSWPYPVVAEGMLYIRDQDVLLFMTCGRKNKKISFPCSGVGTPFELCSHGGPWEQVTNNRHLSTCIGS